LILPVRPVAAALIKKVHKVSKPLPMVNRLLRAASGVQTCECLNHFHHIEKPSKSPASSTFGIQLNDREPVILSKLFLSFQFGAQVLYDDNAALSSLLSSLDCVHHCFACVSRASAQARCMAL
jgi:hypothetical protein